MALKQCPVCGEKYSDTYRDCPFCEEEEALAQGERICRGGRGGKRVAGGSRKSQPSLLSPILIIIILLLAALLAYLLFGDQIAEHFGGEEDTVPGVEDTVPDTPDDTTTPDQPDLPSTIGDGTTTPKPDEGGENQPDTPPAVQDYTAAMELPNGLTLSTIDFSLMNPGETGSIGVTGGNGNYTWFSQNEAVATVDQNGTVTAVSGGTVDIVVTDGEHKGICVVRCKFSQTTAEPDSGTASGGSLHTGAAIVINGGNGVRVRSGPSTEHEILASVPNGADVRIMADAGNGWYQITFSGNGGVTETGYMNGEFLKNN